MAQGGIPPEVQRFIAENIDAAEQLDILLLLYRNPERTFTALEVSQAERKGRLQRLSDWFVPRASKRQTPARTGISGHGKTPGDCGCRFAT